MEWDSTYRGQLHEEDQLVYIAMQFLKENAVRTDAEEGEEKDLCVKAGSKPRA